jgi:hypothetical protein
MTIWIKIAELDTVQTLQELKNLKCYKKFLNCLDLRFYIGVESRELNKSKCGATREMT